jgi:hypothetical protein
MPSRDDYGDRVNPSAVENVTNILDLSFYGHLDLGRQEVLALSPNSMSALQQPHARAEEGGH